MANRSTIGVVTVTYNSGRVVEGFLASLLKQSYSDFTLYISDNGSSDQTLQVIAQYDDPRIHVFRNQDNLGWAGGANQGVEQALADDCPLILLMNNDTEFDASLLAELACGLEQYQCDMIVPKILFFDQPEVIWSAGGRLRRWRGRAPAHYGVFEIDRGQFESPRKVEHGPACCLLVQRRVFEEIGLLDGRFFLGYDDADFCYRAMRAGFTLFYLPAAKMLHKASSSTGGIGSDVSARYNTRGQVIYILKHFGFVGKVIYLPAFQMLLLWRLVTRNINLPRFLLHERAFFEGLTLWRQPSRGTTGGDAIACRTSRASAHADVPHESWTLDGQ